MERASLRSPSRPFEDQAFRLGAALSGAILLASALLAATAAREHMAALGEICGGAAPHCGWCFVAAGLALAGLVAFLPLLSAPRSGVDATAQKARCAG